MLRGHAGAVAAQRGAAVTTPVPAEGPVTATGTGGGNVHGQAIAITVFSTVRWWGKAFLPALFGVTKAIPPLTGTLVRLSFIHFARWSVITELPQNGPPQRLGRLRFPHMYFESNFNGGWEEYIDAFSHILAPGMAAFWGSSYGFPKALPTRPFKAYIAQNEIEASHYWSAYPEATVTVVKAALELEERLGPLRAVATDGSPEEFAAAWRRFLTEGQRWL